MPQAPAIIGKILASELQEELDAPTNVTRLRDATKEASDAAKAIALIGRIEGDVKSLSKRITKDGTWPEEARLFLRFIRETRDTLEQTYPELMK